jgi:hypothetical protein
VTKNPTNCNKKFTGVVGGGGVVNFGVVVRPPDGFFVDVVTFGFCCRLPLTAVFGTPLLNCRNHIFINQIKFRASLFSL